MSWPRALSMTLLLLVLLPVGAATGCAMLGRGSTSWWEARRDSSGQAPDPASTPDAVIQVYAARAVGIRGALGVHSWIAVKPAGAPAYTRYEVIGWGVARGAPAVRTNRSGADNYWFGSRPEKLADLRGAEAEALVPRIEEAVRSYPYPDRYRTWPGPNSNTFVAHVGRAVPELRLDLPPTAIGKDYLPGGALAARSPSGTGVQLSLFGLLGVLVGLEEGIEINLLGLTVGVDVRTPALKLPGVGRLGLRRSPGPPPAVAPSSTARGAGLLSSPPRHARATASDLRPAGPLREASGPGAGHPDGVGAEVRMGRRPVVELTPMPTREIDGRGSVVVDSAP